MAVICHPYFTQPANTAVNSSFSFAAFIMTYERPAILRNTIDALFSQTLPPEKILIVDNSESEDTRAMISELNYPGVDYYRVGYNSGPAGAAKIGLQKLVAEGYQWIYWGDDDNPPPESDVFEVLLKNGSELIDNGIKLGAIGASGSLFNKFSGKLQRLKNKDLNKNVAVDMIAANTFIINSLPVKQGILPHEPLFFGFEELDFCLQMKNRGFALYCHGPMLLRHRQMFNRPEEVVVKSYKEDGYQLRRRYYSYRNLLYIMVYRQRLYWTSLMLMTRWMIKAMLNIRFGYTYFFSSSRLLATAIQDAILRRMGFNEKSNNWKSG